MSHEDLLATGHTARDVLRELREIDAGYPDPETASASGKTTFLETGSVPERPRPSCAMEGDDVDPLTSPFILVERNRQHHTTQEAEATETIESAAATPEPQTREPQEKRKRVGISGDTGSWSLLGLRNAQGYRDMRPLEVEVEFAPTAIADQVAQEHNIGPFEKYCQSLKEEIEAELGRFNFNAAEIPIPEDASAESPQEQTKPREDHPTLNMQITWPGPAERAQPPQDPIAVLPLAKALLEPVVSGSELIRHRMAEAAPVAIGGAADEQAEPLDTSAESLERVPPPKIPRFTTVNSGTSTAEVASEPPTASADSKTLEALPPIPVATAVAPAPPQAAELLTAPDPRTKEVARASAAEHSADPQAIRPLEFSLRGLEKSVEDLLNRHKKAAKVAEYAGAAVLAVAVGSRLFRRLRGRR